MENNVVELKFDRVNEYFEKFKKEYDAEYERNKTSGTRTIVPYHMLIRPAVASGMGLIVVFMAHYGFSNIPKINSNDISGSLSHMIEILSSWVIPAMALVLIASFLINFVRMMAHSYETTIEYTKNEYYRKIKSRMLNKLRTELHDSITESMLVFDTTGMIVSPNLSTNENKKIFSEAERRLKEWKTV
jgi:hypothetical protein